MTDTDQYQFLSLVKYLTFSRKAVLFLIDLRRRKDSRDRIPQIYGFQKADVVHTGQKTGLPGLGCSRIANRRAKTQGQAAMGDPGSEEGLFAELFIDMIRGKIPCNSREQIDIAF